ncbi:MCE family protein [Nocardioides sp. IC4_145]|uniref:MCE family protein n=1 Tax=Nocardioides sp. IC4_145 TaxID=2714037 RepID=UPI001408F2B8|nr:MCE family protein [Nocardioides sp. IC4_145]NHC21569.1 MCE family protein [Nocardioides sp. IC4_145]
MGLLDALRGRERDPSHTTLVVRGAVALVVVALAVSGLVLVGNGSFADRVAATIVLDDAGGSLVPGADVKHRGVVVGRVTALTGLAGGGDDERVEVAVDLDPALAGDVPEEVTARVLPASVFGTSFVDLVAPPGGPRGLAAGARISQDRRGQTLEIQAVLDGLDRVVGDLGPARLATALDGLATALDGNGERLGRTIETLHRYLQRLNPSMPRVRRNLTLLATNLESFAAYAPDLLDATDDALVAARTVVEQEGRFGALVRSGGRSFARTAGLLEANERGLVDMIVRTAVVIDALYDGRRDLVDGLVSTLDFADVFGEALSHGRYLQIEGDLQLFEEPAYGRGACPSYGAHRGRGC